MSAPREQPSPYVRIYLSRRQAEEVRRVVLWHATGYAKSNPLWAALKRIDEGLARNAPSSSKAGPS